MSKADTLPPVFVAGRVKHKGKIVPVGTRLDEARTWKYFDSFVKSGLFVVGENAAKGSGGTEPAPSPSPTEAVEATESDEGTEEVAETTEGANDADEGTETPSEEADADAAIDQGMYDALTVEEVAGLLDDGTLSQDDVLAFESEREGGVRKGVERLLDA